MDQTGSLDDYRPRARAKLGAAMVPQPTWPEKSLQFLFKLFLASLWHSFSLFSVPLNKLLAAYVFTGKSLLRLSVFVERSALKFVGWLSNPAFSREHRLSRLSRFYFAADFRRWHIAAGVWESLVWVGIAPLPCPALACPPHPQPMH